MLFLPSFPALRPWTRIVTIVTAGLTAALPVTAADRPNILLVLTDDLGYGDIACFNPDGKIPTPHVDRLAAEGMRFTDAHTSSSVCTPTRYGLLTGRYNWRSRLQRGVLGGLSPRLIEPDRMTIASMLQQHGYHTAAIGKWHLGMNWQVLEGKEIAELSIERPEQVWNVDYSVPVTEGPNSVGFDYFFGISASLDMVPYTYIENDRVVANPTEETSFRWNLDDPDTRRTRKGPAAPGFDVEDVLPEITRRALRYLGQRASAEHRDQPFFLYIPYASPHTPVVPTPEWQGRSQLNSYADFVMQNDAAFGQLLEALDQHELADNTLVIFMSDNGCSPAAHIDVMRRQGHDPSGGFRGHKADIYEGGHRVPFVVRWPGRVAPGTTSTRLTCLTDIMATVAEIAAVELPPDAAEDSHSFLPELEGQEVPRGTPVVHHSINGSFAIRQGHWKLAFCPGSGGWSAPRPGQDDTSALPPIQLFDLEADPAEQRNLQADHPEVVERLTRLMEETIAQGRSTPGPRQQNDGEVIVALRPAK